MSYAPPSTDATLDAIVEIIAGSIHPNRIILFGSRVRGEARADSDYDFLVEVEAAPDRRELKMAVINALYGKGLPSVDVHVRIPGELERRMYDVGCLDYDVGREGIVVYAAGEGAVRRHLAPVLRVREGSGNPPESVKAWLFTAEQDLLVIEHELTADVVPWTAICFHAQQAAEKYLKVLLIQRNIRPERTHNLTVLLTAARAAGYALSDLDDDCKFMEQFAVEARYSDDVVLYGEVSGHRAAEVALRVVDIVRALLIPPRPPRTRS